MQYFLLFLFLFYKKIMFEVGGVHPGKTVNGAQVVEGWGYT